ncbi:IFIH1 [Branchiostoma lanceolatum]|uniref:RNA helicase n=1 Tax=Branchiostoma lanceolatum TaxID=7740 RepID=A0A8K0ETG8_BRALA|nr:IFIH1 [Branchiostoma lanceolatum]
MAASGGNGPLLLYRILHKIAKELDKKDELEEVKFLCTGIINRSTLEQIDSHLKLFTELTKIGKITEDDFSFVVDLLRTIGREDLLTQLRTQLNEQNTLQQLSTHQPSSANQFQQLPDSSTRPPHQRQQSRTNLAPNWDNVPNAPGQNLAPFQNLGNVPSVALPPISSPQHADAPSSPQQSTGLSPPGTNVPHHGTASPPTPPDTTIPKQVPPNFPTSYQTSPKHLLYHGAVQSHVEGKQTTMQEMREQRERAAETLRNQGAPDIPTSPKQFHSPDTVGSLDKTPTLTELWQHAHDATDALHRMKHEQEEIQNEGKMTSMAEIQEQVGQLHLPDTAGSMDKTTSLIEIQQQVQAAQTPAAPVGIHQGAAQNEENDLDLMEVDRQWQREQAMSSQLQAGILPRSQQQSNNNSSTPIQSSPSQGLDGDVVEDSPSSTQDVKEAASPLEYKTLHHITYQSPGSISSNIGQSPVLSSSKSEDLEVDSLTKPEDLETGPVVRPKIRPTSPPESDRLTRASPIRLDVAQEDVPEGQYSEKVTLREYQKELARSALRGKNVIITCATGSGKTLVSALAAERAWSEAKRKGLPFKALFIVPIRNLTTQQKDQFEMLFPPGIVQEIGDTEELSETLKMKDIVMLTAQIVVNSLKEGTLDLTNLDQLILDECHHTTLDHPYNQIMRYYLMKKDELKLANPQQKRLPQVIGLTASLGVGDSGNALQHLIQLCASLDASRVDHVKENKAELRSHVFTPDGIRILPGQPRKPHDPFSTALDSLMQRLENKVFSDTCPYDRGTQQCENWIVERKKEAEATSTRKEKTVADYLFHFNRALRYFIKLQAVDAIAYLDEEIEKLKGPLKLPIDKFCYQQYNNIRDELEVYADEEETNFPNPLLQQLRSLLIEKFNETESYGIILTQQRIETEAIIRYVEEQDVLRGKVRAKRLVGQGKLEDKAFTDAQQMAVLKSFRKGLSSPDGCNLLVATDVAQEGLDMPKCNFVIRYDFVSNEIGSVQARGRARAKDAECYLLVTAGSINERRELENQEKEQFMKEALLEMDKLKQVDFDTRVKEDQARQLENWKAKQRNKSTRKSLIEAKDVKVYCRNCTYTVCDGTHIIHKGSNYICREPSLPEKCDIVCNHNPQVYRTTDNIGVLRCGNPTCGNQYGPIIKFKKGQEETGYGMNVKSFLFDCGDGQLRAISKWSKAPFDITEEPYV